jgi:hypothetical protein
LAGQVMLIEATGAPSSRIGTAMERRPSRSTSCLERSGQGAAVRAPHSPRARFRQDRAQIGLAAFLRMARAQAGDDRVALVLAAGGEIGAARGGVDIREFHAHRPERGRSRRNSGLLVSTISM